MKSSKLHPILLAAFVLALSIAAIAGKPLPDVPVVSSVAGDGQVLADPTIPNYRVQSDGLGDYFNGVDGVVSILQGGTVGKGAGDWEVVTGDSVRKITIDLREPVDGAANPPFPYATLPGRFIAKCHLVSPASIGGMRGLNTTLLCLLNVRFYVSSRDSYVLSMNRANDPTTNDALVTCTEVSGDPADPNAPCIGWTIDPSITDSTGARNVARLYHPTKQGTEDRGRFYLRFHISVRK
ncbi:MAG TPA: hypothetical protein VNK82_12895 [Terriglobales bacterium]|nr:hypothetical protein [Terriglobales bacterium]